MHSSNFIKTFFALGAIAAAAVANAQISLIVVSDGSYSYSFPTISDTETVVAQSPTLSLTSFSALVNNVTGLGTATYSGTAGTLNIDVDYSLPSGLFVGPSGSHTGSWSYVSGTGEFANLTGGGTLGSTFLETGPNSWLVGTELSGTLNAVPEPAPFAALGLGALGLLIRRRKA